MSFISYSMGNKTSESEKILQEQRLNKNHLEEQLIEKERLRVELEIKLKEGDKNKDNLSNQMKEKEFSDKKEKFYRVIKLIKMLIEKNKIKTEIDKLEKIKNGVEENNFQLKENIKTKQWKIFSLKESIKIKQEEISFVLSQREKGMELFENRWVKKIDIPKLKEARLGITNNFSNLSPYEFEHFVAKLLREIGYSTKVTQKTGDYGVDIIAKKNSDTVAVQCKRFQEGNLVSNRDIQRILGARHIVNANKCLFVTTSKFTKQAIQQAKGCPIELWDKEILHNFVKKYLLDLEIKEIFSLMEKEKREKLEREQEKIRVLEEKREEVRLKREKKKRRIEERKEREKERRTCQRCGRVKMKNRKYCSNCKREIRIENKYYYW